MEKPYPAGVEQTPFGKVAGKNATLYVLRNAAGFEAAFCDYGATWVRWLTPDRAGNFGDVLLGYDDAEAYAKQTAYVGAVCGRCANRIAGGEFMLAGKKYRLAVNNGPNHLHGGLRGFDCRFWSANAGKNFVSFRRRSAAGEEGYPGNVIVTVTYTLEADGAVRIDYAATSDEVTLINLTNHSYFNLAGHAAGTIGDHTLKIFAKHFVPLDADNIPTGEICAVAGTLFDFSTPVKIGLRNDDPALSGSRGYDHPFVVDGAPAVLRPAAELYCAETGRVLRTETCEPTVHVYTGNWLNECTGDVPGKGGAKYGNRSGVALETQYAPDAVNQPAFRANILYPGNTYKSTTVFRPGVR